MMAFELTAPAGRGSEILRSPRFFFCGGLRLQTLLGFPYVVNIIDAHRLANGPLSAKSAEVKPCSGAPNAAKAAKIAFAFSTSAFTRMSRSLVAWGCA
jgi:hypothetical protein